MTTATQQQQQQQDQQQVPPPPPPLYPPSAVGPSDAVLAAAAATALGAAVTGPAAVALMARLYIQAGIDQLTLHAAAEVVMSMPPEVTGIAGPATMQIDRLNRIRRGQMFLSIARRVSRDVKQARAQGESVAQALLDAVQRERRYYGLHRDAMWNRSKAAMAVDMAAMEFGLLLGWHAHRDDRVTPDCLDADGKNFRADAMPLIGFPGTVHAKCRCEPVKPYPGARLLPSA
jgi:hypothetical protein